MSNSPFDDLGKQPDYSEADKAAFERIDHLWHKTFAQTESGRELLDILRERIISAPASSQANDLYSLGYRDGHDDFIKHILLTIKKVDNDE